MERPLFMPGHLALQAEFYQFVLAAVYHADGLWGDATFDLYARGLPDGHGYLVAAGLGPLLDHLAALAFTDEEVELLRQEPRFSKVAPSFFDALRRFRFRGEVWAVPEGTVVYPGEPIVRVTAPLLACTLLETRAIQIVSAATAIATRAARMVDVAGGHAVLDFGSRRCPGPEAALLSARAAYIGGVSATTNALAALHLGIPPMGTMADTFLAAYGDDRLAFEAFRLHFPGLSHLSLPDDDPVDGVKRFLPFKKEVQTVRIDHEDLDRMSRLVRAALDRNGMQHVRILGSGHLDEVRIRRLVDAGAPIQLFAVGRALATAADQGTRVAFRIAEMMRGPHATPVARAGSSPYPGRKQICRHADRDVLCLEHEAWGQAQMGAVPLLRAVVRDGERIDADPPLAQVRQHRAAQVAALPRAVRDIERPAVWPVTISDSLASLSLAAGG
ncbi:MAG: nicotinate phosphoribosyltransferase [Myxococcota bacterium]